MISTIKYRNRLIKLAILPFLIANSAILQGQENDNNPVKLTPCYMEGLSDRLMCGSIAQPLSDNPADGEIDIHFAVIPAIKPSNPDEAVLGFAGGPGQGAIDLARVFDHNLRFARETRDIVLVDQRGTGYSNQLQCDSDDLKTQFAFNDAITDLQTMSKQDTEQCKVKLNVDLSHFTTSAAAKDFEAVRVALGYKGFHLYGVSYGTRIAQEYTRQFPASVITSTLDGVVPMQQSLAAIGEAIDASLQALFERCESDAACNEQFPSLQIRFNEFLARLEQQPIEAQVRHPRTYELIPFTVTKMKFYSAIRLALYSHTTRSIVPLVITKAAQGDFSPLAGLMANADLTQSLAMGMHNAIVCSEDWPQLTPQLRTKYSDTYMGKIMIEGLDIVCPILAVKPAEKAFYKPLQSDSPTLLLSGARDPATPPSWAELAMVNMTDATHLVAPTATHGIGSQTCAPKIVAQFIEQKTMQGINTDCINEANDKQFFMNINGVANTHSTATATATANKE
ncbi:alpha/beta hydrolase [Pseudoalteromonas shioyasakiensis]|uniref:alpha/beta fold hydrolase n=1 Tax=Pseudoalteromonas shioyasakiensis TaxID=1190813 RepID=UPI0021177024|nr:alpha/beta fold hydrolase [Pseudoalteromonas shioyasakiensis]MCQ8877998.1 alpha/beta hydrolase [Pseudoalteromonas shioyasakiensis]